MTDRELLFSVTTKNGLIVETFRSGGPGGQNQNVRETGVRIRHPESDSVGESREERSQLQNKRTALKRLAEHPKFRFWVHAKRRELEGKLTPEQWVEREMKELDHFKVEVKDSEGRWVETDIDSLS